MTDHRSPTTWPMKLAAIDVGTNSIHMVIVHVEAHRIFEIIDREKEMVFLGKRSLLRRQLTEESMERGLSVLSAFRSIADSHHVDQIIATATSAVREASNGKQFVRLIKQQTGIRIDVLSGREEARLITLAVRDVIDLKNRRALIVDIGGGSVELIVADARHIYFVESLKAGVIRLTERFVRQDPPSSKDLKRLQKWLKRKLDPVSKSIQNFSPEITIGTSGTILAFGEMVAENIWGEGKLKLEKDFITDTDVEKINEELQKMTVPERLKLPGLDKDRVEQIIAGGMLLESVMEKCRINEMILCDRALREGLIADYLIRRNPSVPAKVQARELRSRSVLNLLNRWEIDRAHAEHTSKLSLQLFDGLVDLHQYGPWERELLEYSALLHDIGRVISYPGHHKHSWYIVKHANLIGFQASEIDMIAAVVAYHRRKSPKRNDSYLLNLRRKNRRLIVLLSGILRVADALDRRHDQSISRIETQHEGPDHVAVSLYVEEPAVIPMRAAVERSGLLQKALNLRRLDFRSEGLTTSPW